MNGKIALSRPTLMLMAANAILSLVVLAELLLPAQPGTANAATADDGNVALPEFGDTTIAAPPVGQFVSMVERPLFYVDRRMPSVEVEAAPPPTPLRLKLEGIAIAGGSRVAVLRNVNGNGLVQLVEGERYEGWTLDALTSTSATFSRDGEQKTELLLEAVSNGGRR